MITKKPMTEEVRLKIKNAIKNQEDISDIIENYQIKDEYLCGAIIKRFNRVQEDIRNTNFIRCIIGTEDSVTNLSGSNFRGSNFSNAKFLGKTWFRGCDLRNCNFNDCWMPSVEYQHADLRNISICNAFIRIGSKSGFQAKFSNNAFELLSKYIQLDVQK
jgi:uncharacterized protein YjbI with pentapeptide repeats